VLLRNTRRDRCQASLRRPAHTLPLNLVAQIKIGGDVPMRTMATCRLTSSSLRLAISTAASVDTTADIAAERAAWLANAASPRG
jgi:hypothetical protein